MISRVNYSWCLEVYTVTSRLKQEQYKCGNFAELSSNVDLRWHDLKLSECHGTSGFKLGVTLKSTISSRSFQKGMASCLWPQGSYLNAKPHYADTVLCIHCPWPLCQTHFILHMFHYSYCGKRKKKDQDQSNCSSENMPLHKTSSLAAELCPLSRQKAVSRTVRFTMDVCVCVCVLGGVTI